MVLTFQKYSRVRDNGWLIRKNNERGVVMTKKEIKDDLLEQLEAQGKYQNYYLDLIEDYMKYYDLKRKCQQDIKKKDCDIQLHPEMVLKAKSLMNPYKT